MTRVTNLCAGPCTLPTEVLAGVQDSVGGIRASIYNAMPDEGVEELARFMRDFAEGAG